jgi:hypothetical protein
MSDPILERIAVALETIAKVYSGGTATAPKAAATPGTASTAAADAAKAKAADAAKAKAADEVAKKATAEEAAKKAAAAKAAAAKPTTAAGPASGTKAPGGKYTIDQVREKIREVAANKNLGKETAADILDQDGGGVKRVTDLKIENYDKVYEAAAVALQTEGAKTTAAPAAPEDDLM